MLRADEWKPSSKVDAVLSFAQGLLSEPQPDDAVEGGIAREYKENKKEFIKNAKAWTKQYAKKWQEVPCIGRAGQAAVGDHDLRA